MQLLDPIYPWPKWMATEGLRLFEIPSNYEQIDTLFSGYKNVSIVIGKWKRKETLLTLARIVFSTSRVCQYLLEKIYIWSYSWKRLLVIALDMIDLHLKIRLNWKSVSRTIIALEILLKPLIILWIRSWNTQQICYLNIELQFFNIISEYYACPNDVIWCEIMSVIDTMIKTICMQVNAFVSIDQIRN